MKRFNHDYQLQFPIYNFMYVDRETIPDEENFSATKTNI